MRKVGMTALKLLGLVGIVCLVAVVLFAGVLMTLGVAARAGESSNRASCQNNLMQFGMLYKLYAQESPGGHYPPMSLRGFETSGGDIHMTFNFGPAVDTIYPDFLTDPGILICPSTPDPSHDSFMSEAGIVLTEWRGPEEGGPRTLNGKPCTDPSACIHAVDNSYWYWGFVFDKLEVEHGLAPLERLSDAMSELGLIPVDRMSKLLTAQGIPLPPPAGPAQIVHAFEHILLERALPALEAGDLAALNAAADADVPATPGNAGTDTVHRLREGVERFFITDVSNPAAADTAQAEVFVMFDAFGVSAINRGILYFNHIPGGSNVLYMDGHVEFIGFQERPPVTNPVADFAAAVLRR